MQQRQDETRSPEAKHIKIEDIPKVEEMSSEEQRGIVGGFPGPLPKED